MHTRTGAHIRGNTWITSKINTRLVKERGITQQAHDRDPNHENYQETNRIRVTLALIDVA